MACMYTKEEIIEKLKELDLEISDPTTEDELDTSQSRHKTKRSPAQARKAYSHWKDKLYICYPDCYTEYFGSNVMRIQSSSGY